jgi:hypothetical protein
VWFLATPAKVRSRGSEGDGLDTGFDMKKLQHDLIRGLVCGPLVFSGAATTMFSEVL